VSTFLSDTVLVTYTHHRYKDVWPIYFGQLDELFPEIRSYVFSDEISSEYPKHWFFLYSNEDDYWQQWCKNLERLSYKYFIYMQEDFFLYQRPDFCDLMRFYSYLEVHPEISFIRLSAHSELPKEQIERCLYSLPAGNPYVFAMQPALWRRERFLDLYREAKSDDFREKKSYVDASVKLGINGLYVYKGEPKRGMIHYDSWTFPYIATGLIRRKWNMLEYPRELKELTEKYSIDMSIRGFFDPQEPQEW